MFAGSGTSLPQRRRQLAPRRMSRTCAVLLAFVLAITSIGFVDAGAEPTDPTTTPGSSITPDDADTTSTTTVVDGATTTEPDAPPVTSGPGGFGGPQIDPDAPPEPPMPDPSPQVRILLDQLLSQQHGRLVVKTAKVELDGRDDVARFERREDAARSTLRRSRAALQRNRVRLRRAVDDLRASALARYMSPGSVGIERMVDPGDDTGRTRAVLTDVTTGLRLQERADALKQGASLRRRIERDTEALERARAATGRARTRARKQRERAERAAEKIAAEQRLIDVANHRQAVARAAVLDGPADGWSLPIAGGSVFTAEELADWFVQRGFPSRARAPITELAKYYIDEGNDQGIRGDMAFAQSVLETGSFTNRDTVGLNNYAGIGHCDTCASGFAFATPQLGVRAQIQLLADYTERGVKLAHPLVDRRLHGPSGCCQTWWQLTHTWATAGNYGPKIMGVYREMLYWLVVKRGMAPQVGPR